MIRCVSKGAVFILAALTAITSATASTPPPPEAFGTLPVQTDVVLSSDGHWLAWVDHTRPKPAVVIFDLVERKTQRILATPEKTKLRHLLWQDNETLLISLSEALESKYADEVSSEYFRVIAHDVHGGVGRMLPMRVGRTRAPLATLVRARTSKEATVIMATSGWCNAVLAGCLIEVNTRSGEGSVLKVGNEHTAAWVVNRDGRALAREDWDWSKHQYRLYALSGNDIREIFHKDDAEHPLLAGPLADDSAVVLLGAYGRNHQAAWAIPLDGSPARVLMEDPEQDVTGTYVDSYTGAIVGMYIGGIRPQLKWLDPTAEQRFRSVQQAFGDQQVEVYGWTADGTKTLARVQTPSTPPLYYVVDFKTHRADIAAEEYPALAGVPLGEPKAVTYKARDGMTIPAYVTTPPGKAGTAVPLVVLPHGGPNARDYLEFDWLVQFLASRGYAVLQPQFRGSTGFGEAFREAGYRQWGRLMQDDVTDGVRAMIEQGVADPHRICIVGASYGGYVALAGAAFTPQLYACAASISGVADLSTLRQEALPFYAIASTARSDWKAHIGSTSDKELKERSPLYSVSSIKAPVLLIYGTADAVVPNEQSERMARALSSSGKSVTLVKLQGEDHWLSLSATRIEVLRQLELFLAKNL
jgi:dipeptidyl aminopeptidase/acylaminoacyl peptidase